MVSKSQLLVCIFAFLMIFVLVNFIIVAVRKFKDKLPRVQFPPRGCPEKVLFNHTLNPHDSLIYQKTYEKFEGKGQSSFSCYFSVCKNVKQIKEQRASLLVENIPTTEFSVLFQLRKLV